MCLYVYECIFGCGMLSVMSSNSNYFSKLGFRNEIYTFAYNKNIFKVFL